MAFLDSSIEGRTEEVGVPFRDGEYGACGEEEIWATSAGDSLRGTVTVAIAYGLGAGYMLDL